MSIIAAVSEARSNKSLLTVLTAIKSENLLDYLSLSDIDNVEKAEVYWLQCLSCST